MITVSPRRKKIAFIALIIAGLVAVSAIVILFGRDNAANTTEEVEQVSVEGVGTHEGKTPFTGLGSLTELAAQGRDLECQVVYERAGTEGNIEGTYFTSNGNFRGDFMVPAPEFGGKVLSSMIVGGQSMYVWSKIDNNTFGFKTDIASAQANKVESNEPVPLNQTVKYSCIEWTEVDGSVFVPPTEVTFKDLNAVIDAGMEYGNLPPQGEF